MKRVDHAEFVICDWCGEETEATETSINTTVGGVVFAAARPWIQISEPRNDHDSIYPILGRKGSDLCGNCAVFYGAAVEQARNESRARSGIAAVQGS